MILTFHKNIELATTMKGCMILKIVLVMLRLMINDGDGKVDITSDRNDKINFIAFYSKYSASNSLS